jgi:hypothetical protein
MPPEWMRGKRRGSDGNERYDAAGNRSQLSATSGYFLESQSATTSLRLLRDAPGYLETSSTLDGGPVDTGSRWYRVRVPLVDEALKSTRCEEVYRARFWFQKARRKGPAPEDPQYEKEISDKEKRCDWGGGGRARAPLGNRPGFRSRGEDR